MQKATPDGRETAILASGMGLGHYIPAVLFRDHLRRAGGSVELYVFESFLDNHTRENIARTVAAYQRNFGMALVGQRLHHKFPNKAVPLTLPELWRFDEILVFSGYWCPFLHPAFAESTHLLHVDSSYSPTWSAFGGAASSLVGHGAREVWLTRKDGLGCRITLPGLSSSPIPWCQREPTLVLHGGGWALGRLEQAVDILARRGFPVILLLGSRRFLENVVGDVRQIRIADGWQPWAASAEAPFPPLTVQTLAGCRSFITGVEHGAFKLLRNARAVVTKPGGMTLAESLASATPVVFLEALGEHERLNAKQWIEAGFGIGFEEWASLGFSQKRLYLLHTNLLKESNSLKHWRPTTGAIA
jgi:hypothetical protein